MTEPTPAREEQGTTGSDGGDPRIIDDPADATPAWITGVLRAGGIDAEVAGVDFAPIGNGQTSANHRLRLEYRSRRPARAPKTVVLKTAAGPAETRSKVAGGYRSEVGFYQRFARVAAIRVPHCWSAALSHDALRCTLVLEDIHPARAGSQAEGCTVAQATDAVHNLAGLHAPFWNDDTIPDGTPWLRNAESHLPRIADTHLRATAGFVERYRAELSAADAETLRRAADLTARWARGTSSPRSLVHGDYRPDNLLFGDDSDVVAVDWQTLEFGLPTRDLAYFLSTALPPPVRRVSEASLVGAYHRRLVENGVADYAFDTCFDDYRRGMLQGPLITVIGCMNASAPRTDASDRMFLSMAANVCTAIRELGTLDLVTP